MAVAAVWAELPLGATSVPVISAEKGPDCAKTAPGEWTEDVETGGPAAAVLS